MSRPLRFPLEIKRGSATVKIYRVENKGRTSFTVAYFHERRRKLKMFVELEEAREEAASIANSLSKGELDVLHLGNADRLAYLHALDALQPTAVPLELAAKEYAEAWHVLGGKASVIEAAREFARRHPHSLPGKTVPEAVKEMLEAKQREGAGKPYLRVLRTYLGKLSQAFQCPLSSVTSGQLGDFLREMEISGRTKNNARACLGAFFKYCKERGWLPRDHDGIGLLPKFKEAASEIEIFTALELKRFLRHARPELVPFLVIGAFAGLRSAEIERLDWAEVHLTEGFIEVKAAKSKTASRRLVPISPNLSVWLTSFAQPEGPVVPFRNMAKQLHWLVQDTQAGVSAEDGQTRQAVKVVWKKNGLRHSHISHRVAEIQNVNQVALECGNSPGVILRHYRELVRPAESKEWFGILPEPQPPSDLTSQAEKRIGQARSPSA